MKHRAQGSRWRRWKHVVTGVAASVKPLVTAMVDGRTGGVHLVADAAVLAGRRAGFYSSVCKETVYPASLTMPERFFCRTCWRELERGTTR